MVGVGKRKFDGEKPIAILYSTKDGTFVGTGEDVHRDALTLPDVQAHPNTLDPPARDERLL